MSFLHKSKIHNMIINLRQDFYVFFLTILVSEEGSKILTDFISKSLRKSKDQKLTD